MRNCMFAIACCFCALTALAAVEIENAGSSGDRDDRKLFGGYKITPRFCKATRRSTTDTSDSSGPTVCMFNHECAQRNGEVVGACMDGFLFGACCRLPLDGDATGELMESDEATPVKLDHNGLTQQAAHVKTSTALPPPTLAPLNGLITSSGVSHITNALLTNGMMLPTAHDDAVVQIDGADQYFTTTGVTHPTAPETVLVDHQHPLNNAISSDDFVRVPSSSTNPYERTTTPAYKPEELPVVQISISSQQQYTQSPIYDGGAKKKPQFVPKPVRPSDNDKYVLVPTLTHETSRPNKTQEFDSIVNIIHMLNESSSASSTIQQDRATTRPATASYVFGTGTTTTYRPSYEPETRATTKKYYSTSTQNTLNTKKQTTHRKPATSTTFSTYVTRPPSTTHKKTTYKPPPTRKPVHHASSTVHYVPSSTFRPVKTTYANSPSAFVTQKPPTTSYVYSSTVTKRPTIATAQVSGPSFAVTQNSQPVRITPTTSSSPASSSSPPPPTVIVLGPFAPETHPPPSQRPTTTATVSVPSSSTMIPLRKPVTQVTINNHITQNYYSSERPSSPTVLITPKPSSSTTATRRPPSDADGIVVEQATSPYDVANFPPVRHPNLNMTLAAFDEDESTPTFVEDEALNKRVESFVNKIIQGLQEPFDGLKDLVYDAKNNKTTPVPTSTRKPVRKASTTTTTTTTKRPTTKPNSIQNASGRPTAAATAAGATATGRPTPGRPSAGKPTSARPPGGGGGRPPSGRPGTTTSNAKRTTTTAATPTGSTSQSGAPTKKPTTPNKKTKPTKRVTIATTTTKTTVTNQQTVSTVASSISSDYRTECGKRPLVKSARIVGGKGAAFGEFPWQVLVRESTWLGLFTKNKCGGVLISNRYVLTAAHCQPGFLASLVAVFGEFDISGDLESKRPLSRNVKRVIVHRKYDAATFENDLALLELEHPVQFDTHIIPICLPRAGEDFTGRIATVTGWGRLKYGGGVPSVLQEVQVPIMENPVCQEMFRTAGHNKLILESFLCAGYANGQKDSCEGDSGGPLVLQRPDGRYQLAGTVSHGIKCAAPYLPGVYMRTSYYKPWIESITGLH